MPFSKKAELMLFALARFLEETNKKVSDRPLEISISKIEFIKNIQKLNIFKKKERAIYKNLEELEKSNLLIYSNKDLKLSKKGIGYFNKLKKQIEPLLKLSIEIGKVNLKMRTKLRV